MHLHDWQLEAAAVAMETALAPLHMHSFHDCVAKSHMGVDTCHLTENRYR